MMQRIVRSFSSKIKTNLFDPKMLAYIVCPISNNPLIYNEENNLLISKEINVAFPINKQGIPLLLPEDGRKIVNRDSNIERK